MAARKRRIIVLLASLVLLAALVPAFDGETCAEEGEITHELVLDLWLDERPPGSDLRDAKCPLKLAVRNLGFETMKTAGCERILHAAMLHISRPDGSEESIGRFGWRGRRPGDISRGELAAHNIHTPADMLFTMTDPGRYIVWWTQGDVRGSPRSNALVFDRDEEGLHLVP